MKTPLLIIGAAVLLACAGATSAGVLLRDFFGSTNDLGNGTLTRHDAAGNTVLMGGGQMGPTLIGIDGLRAQFPDNSTAVWRAPGGKHAATWFFAASSADPLEPVTPGDENNLALVAGADAATGGHLAALLPFTPPAGSYQVSADMIPEGGDLRDWVAVGFTSSLGSLNNNFEDFGQAWLLLRMNATGLGPTTWELHTNGMAGLSLTGNTMLTGNYMPLSLTYDPLTQTVSGSVGGVLTPSLHYTASGIVGVGMEALEHVSFGVADNFEVQSVPEPVPGDTNGDGKVDFADLLILAQHYGLMKDATIASGDFNADGSVGFDDLLILAQHYGSTAPPAVITQVPEPMVTGLLAIVLPAMFLRQRCPLSCLLELAPEHAPRPDLVEPGRQHSQVEGQ